MEVSLALSVSLSLTLSVDHFFNLLMILLNVTEVILVILTVIVAVVEGTPVTRHPTQELHLSGENVQLTLELSVLLLELSHSSSKRPTQVGCLLQTSFHAQLKSADIHVDLPNGISESLLIAC